MLKREAISVFSSHMNKNDYASMLSRKLISNLFTYDEYEQVGSLPLIGSITNPR